jgi:hypothetical protein
MGDVHARRDSRLQGVLRVRRWLRDNWRSVLFGLSMGLIVVSIALNRDAIDQIQAERQARIAQQTHINCSLSTLVQASLEAGTFGEGVDMEDLNPFQQRVIAAIARVQLLLQQSPDASEQLEIFRRELKPLRSRTNCEGEEAQDRREQEIEEAIRDSHEAVRDRREASKP